MPKPAGATRFFPPILIISLALSLLLNGYFLIKSRGDAVVARVFDGDTFELTDGKRVRLMGVDAPEVDRCMGEEAKNHLTALIAGKHVRLKHTLTDDYGRIVSIVIREDLDSWMTYLKDRLLSHFSGDPLINRAMLTAGLVLNTGFADDYRETMNHASEQAREASIGIYSPTCRQADPIDACRIKGNLRSSTKTYYLPDCKAYTQTIVDLSFGDRWFCTESEAQKAGFVRAANCPR